MVEVVLMVEEMMLLVGWLGVVAPFGPPAWWWWW